MNSVASLLDRVWWSAGMVDERSVLRVAFSPNVTEGLGQIKRILEQMRPRNCSHIDYAQIARENRG